MFFDSIKKCSGAILSAFIGQKITSVDLSSHNDVKYGFKMLHEIGLAMEKCRTKLVWLWRNVERNWFGCVEMSSQSCLM